MTLLRLLTRNLLFHWRGNLAIFLGVVLGTAVLTGALVVGDSLRGSLRGLALDQLGWVDQAMVGARFFRTELAKELPAKRATTAILLQGSASVQVDEGKDKKTQRVSKVQVLGVDGRFWQANSPESDAALWQSNQGTAVLNETMARALQVKVGDSFDLFVQKADDIPRESLLGKRNSQDVIAALSVTVKAIVPDMGMGRFTLKPSPEPVRNVFLPLRFLQEKLDLNGRANALLVGGPSPGLEKDLAAKLTLADWDLRLTTPADRARDLMEFLEPRAKDGVKKIKWQGRVPTALAARADARALGAIFAAGQDFVPAALAARADAQGVLQFPDIAGYYQQERPYLSLESARMFLEPAAVQAVGEAVRERLKLTREAFLKTDLNQLGMTPILVGLADSLADGKNEIPYVVVAGVEPEQLPLPPGAALKPPLAMDEIVLVDWLESPLKVQEGQEITLSYYSPDDHNQLQLRKKALKVRLVEVGFPLQGRADDPDFTPKFPGITDRATIAGWENPPFPFDQDRVKKRPENERFWERHKTTPRAYVTLEQAQELWGNRFGMLTSIRLALLQGTNAEEAAARWQRDILQHLSPGAGGFVFQKVKSLALQAGGGATDFGGLFLGFSFFLILSALLLVGLLVRLNLDRRSREIGLLQATGWNQGQVRRLLLTEGAMLTLFAAGLGLVGAAFYARFLLNFLQRNWPGDLGLSFLQVHVEPRSLGIGFGASVLVSMLTIWWATRTLAKMAPRDLLAGQSSVSGPGVCGARSRNVIWISLAGAAAAFVAGLFVQGHEAKAGSFFGCGALVLTAALSGVWRWLVQSGGQSSPQPSLAGLAVRNAGRAPLRSVLTAGLLAAATFLIVAVESFHRDAGAGFFKNDGGSGGFALIAETDVPIFLDLNQPKVQAEWDLKPDQAALLQGVSFFPCRLRSGDDASCLNLYQPLKPRILGVAQKFIDRGGFRFSAVLAKTPGDQANPWQLLDQDAPDFVPAFVDANTATWILKVGLGDELTVAGDDGRPVKLKIVGLLSESIFQSEVVIADRQFTRHFPQQQGFRFFLIECPHAQAAGLAKVLGTVLGEQGIDVQTSGQRVATYLAVENTYLVTFQALGGLGLLLGGFGLAVVLLRGVWERRGELALLQALGFQKSTLGRLVLLENLFLLGLGLGVGVAAALLSVAPHLATSGGGVLWLRLAGLLGLVTVIGLAAGGAAVLASLRAPLLGALRRE